MINSNNYDHYDAYSDSIDDVTRFDSPGDEGSLVDFPPLSYLFPCFPPLSTTGPLVINSAI